MFREPFGVASCVVRKLRPINSRKGSLDMTTYVMRTFQVATLGIATFAASMTVRAPDANAVVYCAAGVYRAGCVARPVYGATVYGPTVNGVARRTARRTVRRQ